MEAASRRFSSATSGETPLLPSILLALAVSTAELQGQGERLRYRSQTTPTSPYGPHERKVFDLWLAKTDKPAPLVLSIHGGGFSVGDKSTLGPSTVKRCLEVGWSVAAINYRLTGTDPAPAAYLDCGRAIQTLRHRTAEWSLTPTQCLRAVSWKCRKARG